MQTENREPILDSMGNEMPHPTDSADEVFYAWLNKAAIGDVSNVHNLLCQCFNQLKEVKDDLVRKLRKGAFVEPEKTQATDKLNKEVYPMLQRLETRIFKCRDRIGVIQKTMKPSHLPPS
jgi:hypothetical protein